MVPWNFVLECEIINLLLKKVFDKDNNNNKKLILYEKLKLKYLNLFIILKNFVKNRW